MITEQERIQLLKEFRERFVYQNGSHILVMNLDASEVESFLIEKVAAAKEETAKTHDKYIAQVINTHGRVLADTPTRPWIYVDDLVNGLREIREQVSQGKEGK